MKKITLTTIALILITNLLFAQHARFVFSGTIQYEKKVNMYGIIKTQMSYDPENATYYQAHLDRYKKDKPQFKTLKSTMVFGDQKTLFTPEVNDDLPDDYMESMPTVTQNNIIYTDIATATSISQKKVYEQTFLVKDSTRKIKWKITDEVRDIAGYSCRRANAIVLDSVYVVAFYTDRIPVSGGPESFTGLPGMILGVALPHENATWFATKVIDSNIPDNGLLPPKKGKPVNNKEFKATLNAALKDWGSYAQMALKVFSL